MMNAIKYPLFLKLVYHKSVWYYVTVVWIIIFSLLHPYILMEVLFLQDFIREADPDIIIGYNICKFDLPYLIEVLTWLLNRTFFESITGRFCYLKQRLCACCCGYCFNLICYCLVFQRAANLKIAEFPILGRIRDSRVWVKDTTFSSR